MSSKPTTTTTKNNEPTPIVSPDLNTLSKQELIQEVLRLRRELAWQKEREDLLIEDHEGEKKESEKEKKLGKNVVELFALLKQATDRD